MGTPEADKTRAAAAYNAAADHYDDPANTFWARSGRRTIERLALRPGGRVLDVCCGSGESALPAAEAVGLGGHVLAVDLAQALLDLGQAKAAQRGLGQLAFRAGDLLDLGLPAGGFDAVVCVFGIFFVPDMETAVRELWRLVRPGGRLAITTWGERMFEPMNTVFWNAVREVRPELYKGYNPWDRISDPDALRSMLAKAGLQAVEIVTEPGTHPLASPEAWWSLVLGSGYRGTLDQLDAEGRQRVEQVNLNVMRQTGIEAVEMNVIYAVAVNDFSNMG